MAILVLVLVFLVGLFSGADGGDSSQQEPKVAFAPPATPVFGGEAQKKAQKTKTPGPQEDRNQRAREQAPVAGTPPACRGSGLTGGRRRRGAVVTPGPKPPQTSQPKPPQTSQPKPPQAPPPVSEAPRHRSSQLSQSLTTTPDRLRRASVRPVALRIRASA